jgi:hypothetical protein
MSFNTSALSDYTRQNADRLITGLVTGSVTAARIRALGNVLPEVKSEEAIGILDTDAAFQDGETCGFTASGVTSISQRKVRTGAIKVNESLCYKDLEKKYTQQALPAGSSYTEAVFAQEYTDRKTALIAYQNEIALWRGDTEVSNENLNKFDGLLKLIDADPTVVNANARRGQGTITTATNSTALTGTGTSFVRELAVGDKIYAGATLLGTIASITSDVLAVLAANAAAAQSAVAFNLVSVRTPYASPILSSAGITTSNIDTILDGLYACIPEAVLASSSGPVLFMGIDLARTLKIMLKNANRFHYAADMNPVAPFMLPGLDILVQPTPGLSGTRRLVATPDANLFLGTDLMDEEMKVELKYAPEAEEMRFKACWRLGINYAFGSQIVQFTLLGA